MDKTKILEKINIWWNNSDFRFNVKMREEYIEKALKENNMVKVFSGARRVGKTYIIYSLINHYLDRNVPTKNIIYITADIREVQTINLRDTVLELVNRISNINEPIYIFIDEIQEIEDWQEELKLLSDNFNLHFFVSGSSTSLFNKKTSKLTGRFEFIRVLPLSLKEFCLFHNYDINLTNKEEILNEYLINGGYPDIEGKFIPEYLTQVVDSTIYRDLLEDYGIRQPSVLEDILKILADKITLPVSSYQIAKILQQDNEKISNYLKYLEAIYIIYPLHENLKSNIQTLKVPPKYYFNDTGILASFNFRTRYGHLAENAAFVHLLRKQLLNERYNLFYKVINNQEYDFYDGRTVYEVKMNSNQDMKKYELEEFSREVLNIPIIIGNSDIQKNIRENGYELNFISLFDFLYS
jgi:predicted AAA+ superfamily ATPase